MDFAEPCPLVRPGLPLFGFCSSGRSFASALLSDGASRRPPLRLASPLSHRTWAEDFHLLAVKHARHTRPCGRKERVHKGLGKLQTVFHKRPHPIFFPARKNGRRTDAQKQRALPVHEPITSNPGAEGRQLPTNSPDEAYFRPSSLRRHDNSKSGVQPPDSEQSVALTPTGCLIWSHLGPDRP